MPTPKEVFDNPLQYLDFLQSADFEGQYFERKEVRIEKNKIKELKDSIKPCLSAFANTNREGGLLVLGIANDGTVKGIQHIDEEKLNNILQVRETLKNHVTDPKQVNLQDPDKNQLYLLYTQWSSNAICETLEAFPKAWKRVGPQNRPMTEPEREQLKRDKRIVNFENSYCCPYDPDELDEEVVKEFKKAFLETRGSQYGHDTEEVLYQTGAIIKDKENDKYAFTNAGYLFFASNPRRHFANAFVRILKYDICDGDLENKADTILDKDFDGALPNVIRNLRTFLKDSVLFQILDKSEYPSIAVDEALVNAVIHREYAVTTPICCTAYKDKLVVKNPGRILQQVPQHFSLADINLESVTRNPKLVEWMRLIKDENDGFLVRALSEGTRRMREEMEHIGLPAPDYTTDNYTTVTLFNNTREKTQKYSSYTATEIQEHTTLPKGWVDVKLSEFITLESGLRPRGGVRGILEGIPSLGGEHLNDLGGFHYENMKYIPDDFFQALNYGHIFQNDILIVKDGATTGKTSFVDENFPYTHAAVNEHVFIVRVTPEIAIPNFIFYYLFSNKGQDLIRLDFRGATIGGISRNFPKKVEVPLPPLAEQHRIVAKLEVLFTQLDAAVDNLKKARVQLHRYRRSLLKAAFDGELTREWREEYSGELEPMSVSEVPTLEGLPELPDGWVWTKVNDISEFIRGVSYRKNQSSKTPKDNHVPILRANNINSQLNYEDLVYVQREKVKGEQFVKALDIVIAMSSGSKHLVGKAAQAHQDFEGGFGTFCGLVRVSGEVNQKFVGLFFQSPIYRNAISRLSMGININNLRRENIETMLIPLPPLTEQEQIVSELERLLSVADEIEATLDAELERSERLRQSILKQAFSGKLVPQDLNDEPASVLLEKIQEEKGPQQPKRKKTIPKSKTTLSAKQMSLPLN